jgi:glutamate-1-semialdehyde 2,1-aminomutase
MIKISEDQLEFSERAHGVIPGGGHTYSRGDDQFPLNAPRVFVRGKGARVWDLDGNEYVDWGMGINNVLVGHAEDEIDNAAIAAIRNGQAFSRPTPLEVSTAEKLLTVFKDMDMVKFGKNGSDPNSAAIRMARAITGRSLVAYDSTAPFLAIHDWFIGKTVVNAGVPEEIQKLTIPFIYNDVASVEQMFVAHTNQIAAVILEVCREVKPTAEFLQTLRRLCTQHGTLLIFDEVVTAFRYALQGAHSLFNITPDFMSVGKGMANGYALAALLGKREYMERGGIRHQHERIFFLSTTNGPEQVALAAGSATVDFYLAHDVIGHLYEIGKRLMDGINHAAATHGVAAYLSATTDFTCRPVFVCRDAKKEISMEYRTLFLQEMTRRHIFMPWICPSYRHGEAELAQTLAALDEACAIYAQAIEAKSVEGFLVGRSIQPVFRKYN